MCNKSQKKQASADFTGIPVFKKSNDDLRWITKNRWGGCYAVCPSCNKKTTKTRTHPNTGLLVYECRSRDCDRNRTRFSPLIGTPLAGTKMPISYWLFAAREFNKGYGRMSTNQLSEALSISFVSAVKLYQRLNKLVENNQAGILGEFAPKKSAIMKRKWRHAEHTPTGDGAVVIPKPIPPAKLTEPWSKGGQTGKKGQPRSISPRQVASRFNEEEAVRFFVNQRWGNGVTCPTCKGSHCKKTSRTGYFRCYNKSCKRNRFNYKTDSPMMYSKLTAQDWLLGFYEVNLARQGTAALEYMFRGEMSYKTSFYFLHRIRLMAAKAPDGSAIGPLEIDEMFIKSNDKSDVDACGKHRNKVIIGARCRTTGNIFVECIPSATGKEILDFVNRCTGGKKVAVFTDAYPAYRYVLPQYGHHHEYVVHQDGSYAKPSAWKVIHEKATAEEKQFPRNIVSNNGMESTWRQIKSSLVGVYRKISTKYLMAYLAEFTFRLSDGRCSRDIGDRVASLYLNGIGKRTTYASMTAG